MEPACAAGSAWRTAWPHGRATGHGLDSHSSGRIAHIADVLLSYAHPNLIAARQALIDFINQQLIPQNYRGCQRSPAAAGCFERAVGECRLASDVWVSRRACAIYSTGARVGYDWPPEEGVVDRDLDLAISQFAPGCGNRQGRCDSHIGWQS